MRHAFFHLAAGCIGCVVVCGGCLPTQSPTRADLSATDTGSRVPAIVEAGRGDEPIDADTVSELIRALGDGDPAVRLFAIQSLQQRFGQTLDYRYYASPTDRDEAIGRWRVWQNANVPTDARSESLPKRED